MNLVLPPEAAEMISQISGNSTKGGKVSVELDANQSFLLTEASNEKSSITVLKSKHIILKHQGREYQNHAHQNRVTDDEQCFVKGYN